MNSANMYDSPSQFEPLIPFLIPPSLTHKASDIVLSSTQLGAAAHPSARAAVRELVRSMNSPTNLPLHAYKEWRWPISRLSARWKSG